MSGSSRTHHRSLLAHGVGATIKSHPHAQQNHRKEANQMSSVLAEKWRRQIGVARCWTNGGVPYGRKLQKLLEKVVEDYRYGVNEVSRGHSVSLYSGSCPDESLLRHENALTVNFSGLISVFLLRRSHFCSTSNRCATQACWRKTLDPLSSIAALGSEDQGPSALLTAAWCSSTKRAKIAFQCRKCSWSWESVAWDWSRHTTS